MSSAIKVAQYPPHKCHRAGVDGGFVTAGASHPAPPKDRRRTRRYESFPPAGFYDRQFPLTDTDIAVPFIAVASSEKVNGIPEYRYYAIVLLAILAQPTSRRFLARTLNQVSRRPSSSTLSPTRSQAVSRASPWAYQGIPPVDAGRHTCARYLCGIGGTLLFREGTSRCARTFMEDNGGIHGLPG